MADTVSTGRELRGPAFVALPIVFPPPTFFSGWSFSLLLLLLPLATFLPTRAFSILFYLVDWN